MANVNGILGRQEVQKLAFSGAVRSVQIVAYQDGFAVLLGVFDSMSQTVRFKCMTKSQSLEVRVFRSLNTAYAEIRQWWGDTVEVIA